MKCKKYYCKQSLIVYSSIIDNGVIVYTIKLQIN